MKHIADTEYKSDVLKAINIYLKEIWEEGKLFYYIQFQSE